MRTYKPRPDARRYKKHDREKLQKAIQELFSTPNATYDKISKKYNISKSVLQRHSTRLKIKQPGSQTALSFEEEEILVESINKCAEWGHHLVAMDLRKIVKMYLDNLGVKHKKFKNNLPGPEFVQGFRKRHSSKTKKVSSHMKSVRFHEVSPAEVKKYHNDLKNSLEGIPPSNIINYCEMGLTDDPGNKEVMMRHVLKSQEGAMNHRKISISIVLAGTADGEMLPPYVIYKSLDIYDTWVMNGPEGTRYNRTSSGWFEDSVFEDWVETIAIPFLASKSGPKCLLGDNVVSHNLTVDFIKKCKDHDLDFIFLPPKSSHLLQPVDVAFFQPIERMWRHILLKWEQTCWRQSPVVAKDCFPRLLKVIMDTLKSDASNNIIEGFRKTGINPLSIDEMLSRLPHNGSCSDVKRKLIEETVLDYLKEKKNNTNTSEPKRKRKLNVVSMKSILANESNETECNPNIEQTAEN